MNGTCAHEWPVSGDVHNTLSAKNLAIKDLNFIFIGMKLPLHVVTESLRFKP